MSKQAILSICIPIYNRIEYLKRDFDQFLKCKELFEEKVHLFISDNCSTDNNLEIINSYVSRYPFIRCVKNTENMGADRNFLQCMMLANGKFTMLLSDDDILVENGLAKILDFLEINCRIIYLKIIIKNELK